MKNSKETRTCVGCRKKFNKNDLIRIVNINKEVTVDLKQKIMARGAYICKNQECFEKAIKNKSLNKALKTYISEDKYNEIRGVMFD